MTIPFQDLGRLHSSIREELDAAVRAVVDASSFIGGPIVSGFEERFAAAHGAASGAGCGSGTDALSLALRALGVGPGDEAIVPAMTFVATAEAVVHVGATPVLADVDPTTLLLTQESVERVRTKRTRAVIPVHLYGHAVPVSFMRSWRESGLLVVEDAAQAHLATGDGQPVGSAGHAACFSFYPGKNLGAWGDGGMVISNDPELTASVRVLRDHGRRSKYTHDDIGYCSRLDGLQAAVLDVKLRHLPAWTANRKALADRYRTHLEGRLVPWENGAVHHLLVLRTDGPATRERLQGGLRARGIASGIHYPAPLSAQPSLDRWSTPCPVAEKASREVLSLPIDPLMTITEVDQVCEAVLALTFEPTG